MEYCDLIDLLEFSVEKNGEQPLTNRWLLNIVRMAQRKEMARHQEDDYSYLTMDDIC